MIRYLYLLLAVLVCSGAARGLSVESTAGALRYLIENPSEVAELEISGTINASDLDFIDSEMTALRSLDMSRATIAAYEGKKLRGLSKHEAGTIPARMFVGSRISEIKLPAKGILNIADAAFAGSAVEVLTLGQNVAEMGVGCFSSCPNLKSVAIEAAEVGESAFANCGELAEVSCSADVKKIGAQAFKDCPALASFSFGNGLGSIGDEAFMGAGLVSADLSACMALNNVGNWAFASMPRLESLNLGSAAEVGNGVVFGCKSLKKITFSSAATIVGDYAYAGNAQMQAEGLFNDKVVSIGDYALSGLTHVRDLTLPEALEYIGSNAMERMSALERIEVRSAAIPALGENVWAEVEQQNVFLYVPEGQSGEYGEAEQWNEFIIVDSTSDRSAATLEAASLKARFEGDNLVIKITGEGVMQIELYDLAGTLLASVAPQGPTEIINTTDFATRFYIVQARLKGERFAILKIAKR